MGLKLKQIIEKRNLEILPEKKQIKIDKEDIQVESNAVDLNKKITWADENIFSKLKKIEPIEISLQVQLDNINIKLDLILSKL